MRALFIFVMATFMNVCLANNAEIIEAKAELTPAQKYNFTVTVKHPDTGWDHYVIAWRIYSPADELIGERVLYHPHVNKQPFTRSLLGIRAPLSLKEVVIKAVCSTTGENVNGYRVKLR